MNRVHFVLVCHCKRVKWGESAYNFEDMESAIRSMIETVAKVEDEYGIRIPMTYLPCFSHEKDECYVVKE